MLTALLLIIIIWLLWTLHQDLLDMQSQHRNLREELSRLAGEATQMSQSIQSMGATQTVKKVNINKASKTALRTLPRIGAVIADRIIEGRPFNSIEDLLELEGFSPEVLAATREHLTLEDN